MRRPGKHDRETDSLESLRLVQHQGNCSQIFFSCSVFEPLRLHQNFPDCLLSSSISAISSVSINTILPLSFHHFWCSQSFPPAYQRRHQRNRPLTRDILRYQEEHRRTSLLRPFSTLFHLFPITPPLLLLFLSSTPGRLWMEAVASHSRTEQQEAWLNQGSYHIRKGRAGEEGGC